jgi:hypothetical protein
MTEYRNNCIHTTKKNADLYCLYPFVTHDKLADTTHHISYIFRRDTLKCFVCWMFQKISRSPIFHYLTAIGLLEDKLYNVLSGVCAIFILY